jgi:hypothetical protein
MSFVSALPTLLRVSRKASMLRAALGCRGAERLHSPAPGALDVPDLDWSHCPIDLLGSPFMQAIHGLDRLARIAPLAGWPGDFAPWVVVGLMVLREEAS